MFTTSYPHYYPEAIATHSSLDGTKLNEKAVAPNVFLPNMSIPSWTTDFSAYSAPRSGGEQLDKQGKEFESFSTENQNQVDEGKENISVPEDEMKSDDLAKKSYTNDNGNVNPFMPPLTETSNYSSLISQYSYAGNNMIPSSHSEQQMVTQQTKGPFRPFEDNTENKSASEDPNMKTTPPVISTSYVITPPPNGLTDSQFQDASYCNKPSYQMPYNGSLAAGIGYALGYERTTDIVEGLKRKADESCQETPPTTPESLDADAKKNENFSVGPPSAKRSRTDYELSSYANGLNDVQTSVPKSDINLSGPRPQEIGKFRLRLRLLKFTVAQFSWKGVNAAYYCYRLVIFVSESKIHSVKRDCPNSVSIILVAHCSLITY